MNASAPSIPVARPSFGRTEEEAIVQALRSGWVSQGPRVAEFERRFAEYAGAPYAVAVSSCTTALHLALLTAGVKPGDEVLCPSLSFIATANAIVHAGAVPVFVDVTEVTYNMDPRCVEHAITPRTKAILVVHQIGLPAQIDEIAKIARRHGVVVLEDAACAIGADYKGHRIGRPHTAMACFSFHPRKILTTGEGGMITTSNADFAGRLRRLRQHAMSVSDMTRHASSKVVIENYDEVGYNYRMTDLQAAIGLAQMERLEEMLARRRELAERYSAKLASISWLITPQESPECRHNFQSYMMRISNGSPITRAQLMQELLKRGISTRRGVMAIHREAPYHDVRWDALLPVTNRLTDNTIILPLFQDMSQEEQDYIIDTLHKIAIEAGR